MCLRRPWESEGKRDTACKIQEADIVQSSPSRLQRPGRTSACRRRLTASARSSLPLSAAPLPMDDQNRVKTAAGLSMVSRSGVSDTSWAMAHINALSSRAMATTTWLAFFPLALICRWRLHTRTWAFQLLFWIDLDTFSRRSCSCRLTFAGSREAQAPSTSARRAWLLPVLVMPPCRRRSPVEYSEGVKPR